MTILSVVKDVCAAVGVLIPQSLFSNLTGNRTAQEMLSLANEMAQRIAYDTRDWTMLQTGAIFTGDGTNKTFPLPANYKRMLLTSNVWRSTQTQYPMRFVPDADEWLRRRAQNIYDSAGEWRLLGGSMNIEPVMAAGTVATFIYMDKNCVNLTSGGRGNEFMNDNDTFALDERLLKLGMIWQWKAQKGSAYAEDMGTYGDALTYAMGHDQPAPIILGKKPMSAAANIAYPWPVPT